MCIYCKNPETKTELINNDEIYISNCDKLMSINNIRNIKLLTISNCKNLKTIENLTNIGSLIINDCIELHNIKNIMTTSTIIINNTRTVNISGLHYNNLLHIYNCNNVNITDIDEVNKVIIEKSNNVEIKNDYLTKINTIKVDDCDINNLSIADELLIERIVFNKSDILFDYKKLKPNILVLNKCNNLTEISETIICDKLIICNCYYLEKVINLQEIRNIIIDNCSNLKMISNLVDIENLKVTNCSKLERIDNLLNVSYLNDLSYNVLPEILIYDFTSVSILEKYPCSLMYKGLNEADKICCICMNNMSVDNFTALSCGHSCCSICVEQLERCHNCRRDIIK